MTLLSLFFFSNFLGSQTEYINKFTKKKIYIKTKDYMPMSLEEVQEIITNGGCADATDIMI